jgi:hypothetical protein
VGDRASGSSARIGAPDGGVRCPRIPGDQKGFAIVESLAEILQVPDGGVPEDGLWALGDDCRDERPEEDQCSSVD